MTANTKTSVVINLRMKLPQRQLIDQAASAVGKNRSEFLLEAATRAAQETLADQRVFPMTAEQWKRFHAALDARPRVNAKLRKVLAAASPWETSK
ncbi:MAG: DUF1778 domain-containing protein [Gemmatales bacterium]